MSSLYVGLGQFGRPASMRGTAHLTLLVHVVNNLQRVMRSHIAVLVLALLMVGAGCEVVGPPDDDAPAPLTALPRALTVGEAALIESSNAFAFELLREVRTEEDGANVFLSPLSASMALAMTTNGAVGSTLEEMRTTLGFGDLSLEEMNASFRALIDLLVSLDEGVEMRVGNSLWLDRGIPFHDAFLATVREGYGATAEELDFSDPASPDRINGWVRESTNGRIDRLIGTIDDDAVLYLINAIYFKGTWATRFNPNRTGPAPFYRANGQPYDVPMMHAPLVEAAFAFGEDAYVLDLPYSRGAYSMTIVLPPADVPLSSLFESLDEARWERWLSSLQMGTIDVFLPRFRLEYEKSLKGPLAALGMRQAFDANAADFSNLSPLGEDMYVSEVKQKTFLEVNEEGTEAAAATSVEVGIVSMPPSFRVDRPFLLAIRERLSGTIVFLGAIGAPDSV